MKHSSAIEPAIVRHFGSGDYVVGTGRLYDRPLVLIYDAANNGEVGMNASESEEMATSLQPGMIALTFPTDQQARLVADALANKSGWRKDLDNIPKDGTEVDLFVRGKRITNAYWINSMQVWFGDNDEPIDPKDITAYSLIVAPQ